VTKEAPLKQIKEMQYYQKYSGNVYIIGIVFDKDKRNISRFEWEKLV